MARTQPCRAGSGRAAQHAPVSDAWAPDAPRQSHGMACVPTRRRASVPALRTCNLHVLPTTAAHAACHAPRAPACLLLSTHHRSSRRGHAERQLPAAVQAVQMHARHPAKAATVPALRVLAHMNQQPPGACNTCLVVLNATPQHHTSKNCTADAAGRGLCADRPFHSIHQHARYQYAACAAALLS